MMIWGLIFYLAGTAAMLKGGQRTGPECIPHLAGMQPEVALVFWKVALICAALTWPLGFVCITIPSLLARRKN